MNLSDKIALLNKISSSSDVFVYTFVNPKSLDEIKKKGIMSGKLVVKDQKVLSIARPSKKDQKEFKEMVEENLSDDDTKIFAEGISAFFTLPDFSKLPDFHFINKRKLVPIKINLSKLLKDHPDTVLFGVEMAKYDPKKTDQQNWDRKEKNLSLNKVRDLTEKSPSELWKHYEGTDRKRYAPDVPHLLIRTKMFKIPPKYIVL